MTKIFITSDGRFYKSDEAKDSNDMERMNPSQEQLDALPDDESLVSPYVFENRQRLLHSGLSMEEINKVR